MRTLVLAAVLAAFSFPALAQTECRTVAELKSQIPEHMIGAHLTGEDAARFIQRFNAEPPESEIDADEIVAVEAARYPAMTLGFFKNDCFVGHGYVHLDLWATLIGPGT